jgi:uncharacterized protein (DUF1697 family)
VTSAQSALDYALALCDDNPMERRPAGLTRAFGDIVRTARRARVRIVVCGAFARNVYLRPRTTDDADFLVRSLEESRKLVAAASALFSPRGEIDPITRLVHRETKAKIDLIVAEYPFELAAIEHAKEHPVRRMRVPVIGAVPLAAMKIDAASDPNRYHDFGEAVHLLVSGAADEAEVAALVRRDLPACVPTLEAILRAVARARTAPRRPPGRRR